MRKKQQHRIETKRLISGYCRIVAIIDFKIHFWCRMQGVVSRSAEQKQKVYYPRVSAEAEDVRYTIRGFGVLIKNDFEV